MRHSALRRYFRHGMLPQLMVFEAVARLGSFTRAGEELCLAQPTVSVQVRKLSESLGLPLLESSGRKVVLTEAGKEVYQTVQVLFRFFIAADQRLEALRKLRGVAPRRQEPEANGNLVGETGAG
jgi:LysR family transcriptional regulator, low CO2-responsive transcriptional regulator